MLSSSNEDGDALARPLQLSCGVVLPNRLAKAAMSEQLATLRGRPTQSLVSLYGRWASSGCGLLITGNVMVDANGVSEPRQVVVQDRRDLAVLREWARAGAGGGAEMWMQINHAGRQIPRTLAARPAAPSAVPMSSLRHTFGRPRTLSSAEIEVIVGRYARTAAVAVEAGFGGVQIHGAHGYLVSQFLSPLSNCRDDEWGGDPQRRRRFLLEIVAAVRSAVGAGTPISVKLNSSDFQRGGFDEEESMRVVEALEEAGVDLLEISGGTFEAAAMTGQGVKESTRAREAYFLDFAERVRSRVAMPLMLTGGMRTGAAMRDAVGRGVVDVCGIARPLAVDQEFVGRSVAGGIDAAPPPRAARTPSLTGAGEIAWHTYQLRRLASGRTANLRRSTDRALAGLFVASARDALLRKAFG